MAAALKSILTISASRSLTGHPIRDVLDEDWKKADPATTATFDNQGFDVDLEHFDNSLEQLRASLKEQHWDGVIVGWCMRGYKERTDKFERIMDVLMEELKGTKVMFCKGPDDLYGTAMRHFG